MSAPALWTTDAMVSAMRAQRQGALENPLPQSITGISIDSRSIGPGEAFFAITGDNRDGHDFVAPALAAGAALAVVAADRRAQFPADAPLLVVPDVLAGLRDLASAARARFQGKVIGVTGSVGKTGTKEALRLALSKDGETHASIASYNNHWGVPLSLARCPANARYAVFEMGMNHEGEIEPLTRLVRPHVAIITTIAPVHLEFLGSLAKIADAKAEIFFGIEPGGAAILNRDIAQFAQLRRRAKAAGVARIVSFGEHKGADARLIKCVLQARSSTVEAQILGIDLTYKIGAPGRHLVGNSLAVLAAVELVGADLALAALALGELDPVSGRGAPIEIEPPGGSALIIDDSYNANPASVAAALSVLGQAAVGPRGRRIAVLGDMLELGPRGRALHRSLAESVVANAVDLVFCCGPLMHSLWQALPASRRGGYAEDSSLLEAQVLPAIHAGDVVMVKGSLGSRMAPIVKALQRAYPRHDSLEDASAQS
jgi:UDP-N-acetylmuramoyl-tripeptide--D-alanyl-D-alanine ligase